MTRVKGGAPHVLQLPPPPGQTAQSRGQHHFRVNKAPSLASALYKLENRYPRFTFALVQDFRFGEDFYLHVVVEDTLA